MTDIPSPQPAPAGLEFKPEPNDGGPAFPVDCFNEETGKYDIRDGGMSLRDYFAAKALVGMLARPGGINPKQDAEFAYLLADAMLKARTA